MTKLVLLVAVLAIAGYFAWNEWQGPAMRQAQLDDCHRTAGRFQAMHESGGNMALSDRNALLSQAQGCSSAFGLSWASDSSSRASALRAEGAAALN